MKSARRWLLVGVTLLSFAFSTAALSIADPAGFTTRSVAP